MRWLAGIASPAVWLLGRSTDLLLRLVPLGRGADPAISDQEVKVLVREGTAMGAFREEERVMIENVLRLGDRRVSAVMTPRTRMVAFEVGAGADEVARQIEAHHHSRYPVFAGQPDDVIGVVTSRELLVRARRGEPFDLRATLHAPAFVPEQLPAPKMIEAFRERRPHLALVVDEHGGIAGLVTAGDLLEAVVGDMPSSHREEAEAVRRADGSWLLDGGLAIDQARAILEVVDEAEEGPIPYETLAGLVLARLDRIPKVTDSIEWQGWRIEVVDMDGRRTDKLLATRLPRAPEVAPGTGAPGS
jgi:putative hemolysin